MVATQVPRVLAPLAAAALALAVGALAERAAIDGDIYTTPNLVLDVVVGVATVLAGAVTWAFRPESRVGRLVVAMGGLWFLGAFGYGKDAALVDLVGFPLQGFNDVLLIVLLLTVSPGGASRGPARLVAVAIVGAHVLLGLAGLLLRTPIDVTSCLCVPNRITGIVDPDPYELAVRVLYAVETALAVAAVLLLARRWRTASGPARRTLGALLLAGVATVAIVFLNRLLTRVVAQPHSTGQGMITVLAVVRTSIPVAIAVSLVRGRLARTRVADVLVSLADQGVDAGTPALRRALVDPGVRLLRWSEPRRAYVDDQGAEVRLPGPGEARAATFLEHGEMRLGALVHDASLREEPELLAATAAAARLALHNERLALQAEQRLEEVRASRERIVAAQDTERRRLERDLHDGVQQRLLALAVRLRRLQQRASGAGDLAVADDLDAAIADLDGTMVTIRETARGIRPPLLVEVGLEPALQALADGMPVAVEVEARLPHRLPETIEATLYFAASEALANVLRHAGARRVGLAARAQNGRVTLTVTDDGTGGAAANGAGTGLIGLEDRLVALGGSLTIRSPAGQGTTLIAELPIGDQPDARR